MYYVILLMWASVQTSIVPERKDLLMVIEIKTVVAYSGWKLNGMVEMFQILTVMLVTELFYT